MAVTTLVLGTYPSLADPSHKDTSIQYKQIKCMLFQIMFISCPCALPPGTLYKPKDFRPSYRVTPVHAGCGGQGSDLISGPIEEEVSFLADLFTEGYQYHSLNAYSSAIFSMHTPVEGVSVGRHPLVSRLLRVCFMLGHPYLDIQGPGMWHG